MEAEEQQKTERPWKHLSREWRMVDTRWQRWGGVHISRVHHEGASTIARTPDIHRINFISKKLTLSFIAHKFVKGRTAPPMSSSCPPGIINVDGVLRPFLLFAALLLPCIILKPNWRTKNGGGLGIRLGITGKYHNRLHTSCNYYYHPIGPWAWGWISWNTRPSSCD